MEQGDLGVSLLMMNTKMAEHLSNTYLKKCFIFSGLYPEVLFSDIIKPLYCQEYNSEL